MLRCGSCGASYPARDEHKCGTPVTRDVARNGPTVTETEALRQRVTALEKRVTELERAGGEFIYLKGVAREIDPAPRPVSSNAERQRRYRERKKQQASS